MTGKRDQILRALHRGSRSADEIAAALGYRPARAGRLAVTSILRALERQGLVGRTPPRDRWSATSWFAKTRTIMGDA
mgnify:CR=1 FL=1